MVRTHEALHIAPALDQRHAPVTADIGQHTDIPIIAAHDDQGFGQKFYGEKVPGFGDFIRAAQTMPAIVQHGGGLVFELRLIGIESTRHAHRPVGRQGGQLLKLRS